MKRTCILAVLIVVVVLAGPVMAQDRGTPKPNVVLMLADNVGGGDIGAYGGGEARGMPTPSTLPAAEVSLAEFFKSQGFDENHVGVIETTDGTLYRGNMECAGVPEVRIQQVVPRIHELELEGTLKPVREDTVDYRQQVEGDERTSL